MKAFEIALNATKTIHSAMAEQTVNDNTYAEFISQIDAVQNELDEILSSGNRRAMRRQVRGIERCISAMTDVAYIFHNRDNYHMPVENVGANVKLISEIIDEQ